MFGNTTIYGLGLAGAVLIERNTGVLVRWRHGEKIGALLSSNLDTTKLWFRKTIGLHGKRLMILLERLRVKLRVTRILTSNLSLKRSRPRFT